MIFVRLTPEAFAALQPAIDEFFRDEYIASGRCEHIFDPETPTQSDGKKYLAIDDWMLAAEPEGLAFLSHPDVEQITQEEFEKSTQSHLLIP